MHLLAKAKSSPSQRQVVSGRQATATRGRRWFTCQWASMNSGIQITSVSTTPMATLAGTGQALAPRIPTRPETEPGSKPLDNMGWQPPAPAYYQQLPTGGATRFPTHYQNGQVPDLRASRSWIILAILMVAGPVVGILIAVQSG